MLAEEGIGAITAATLIGRTAGAQRFPTDGHFARFKPGGDRQLNCALHRIAITRARTCPPTARLPAAQARRRQDPPEAYRCLKRHLAHRI